MATASPQPDSTRPYPGRPPARAASEPRNSTAAPAWQAACTRPTRCWPVCSADQSASPVATAGTVPAIPVPISTREARSEPRNTSSSTADVQQPSGSRTSAGWAGWPNGTPCSASVRGPAGSARTTLSDSPWTAGSSTCARSTRSAIAAGRHARATRDALRPLRARRTLTRDCRTPSAYPPGRAPYLPPNAESPDTSARLENRAARWTEHPRCPGRPAACTGRRCSCGPPDTRA